MNENSSGFLFFPGVALALKPRENKNPPMRFSA